MFLFRSSLTKGLIGLFILATFLFALYTFSTPSLKVPTFSLPNILHSCSPADYSAGEWTDSPHTTKTNLTKQEDVLAFSGFNGCASSREFFWHLAADREEQWDRFPAAQSWKWVPGKKCKGLRELDARELIKDLVEDGGWYLVGDSGMENQFFSLSCILHGHVIATPDYTTGRSWDRGRPQNLYLAPSSPLVASINFPRHFDLAKTPLVTFRQIDILFSKDELIQIHREIQPPDTILEDASLFGDQDLWTVPLPEYLAEFFAPLPRGNYKTMIVSTAKHWTTETFSKTSPPGMDGVLNLFKHAVKRWADKVEAGIRISARATGLTWRLGPAALKARRKRAVVLAYSPGHEDCHTFREPWKTVQPFKWNWWGKFNDMFNKLLSNRKEYPDIHYLGIDRPARLRPDAHVTDDCVHIMVGAGVLEGWSHYIWHFITREFVTDFLYTA